LVYLPPAVPRPLATLALALALGAASCAAPLRGGPPCPETACGDGRTCVAGRCRTPEAPAAAVDAVRVVLEPADVAVVALSGGGGGEHLPDTIALGRGSTGTVVMLFRFEATWRDDAEITSAFLVLHPFESAPPSVGPVAFEMARIVEPWEPSVVSWGRQPRLDVPIVAGAMRARPSHPMRVDVTPLVRAWSRRSAADHGIALLAKGGDESGVTISMGVSLGAGPRLEAYVK
jgi:hypothetical protein